MLPVAARIPDAAPRDQFADRLAHKARITEEVVRAEIRKAAVQKQTDLSGIERRLARPGQVKPAEMGLIWALVHSPAAGLEALAQVEPGDLDGLGSRAILEQARSLQEWPPNALPETLFERLNKEEAGLVEDIGRHKQSPGDPGGLRPGPETDAIRPRARRGAAGNRPVTGGRRRPSRAGNRRAVGPEKGPCSAHRIFDSGLTTHATDD